MSRSLRVCLGLLCMFGWTSIGHCAFSDDMSFLQEHVRALPQKKGFPDISKIIGEVQEAAESAKDAAENINKTVHDKLDQAASATSTAIQTVVTTVREGLETILTKADSFENSVSKAVDKFTERVETDPRLETFELTANRTLDHFGAALGPLASALRLSLGTVRDVLSSSGFHDVSTEVDTALTRAMSIIDEANTTTIQLKQRVGDLQEKVNKSAGKLSSEIDDDLKLINEKLHDLADDVNTIFVNKTLEAYNTMVSHIHEKVESVLPEKQLKQVVDALDTIPPIVQDITDHVADPVQSLQAGFEEAVKLLREKVPSDAYRIAHFSLSAFLVSVCFNFVTL